MEQNYHNRDYDINELLCDVYDHKGEVVVMHQHALGSLPGLVGYTAVLIHPLPRPSYESDNNIDQQ